MCVQWGEANVAWILGRKLLPSIKLYYYMFVAVHTNRQCINIHSLGQVHSFKCVATYSDLILTPGDYEIQAIL